MLAASLASGCHVVLEGPPGTGKSTLLRAVADGAGFGVEFVEGNAELTPSRLVGHHDPALVLETGYRPDTFVDGPLLTALREGRLLYIEELNRVPEETLNVLVGALAEGEIHVPRLGRIPAAASFRLIAAMNPFDAVGTARVSQAIADRMCRIAIGYQDAPGEQVIVERVTGASSPLVAPAVELTRLTREHAQVRMGASVRGAIDLVRLGRELSALRGEAEPVAGRRHVRRRRDRRALRPAAARRGLRADARGDRARADRAPQTGRAGGVRAPGKSNGPAPQGGAGRSLSGAAAQDVVRERGRRTMPRDQLAQRHGQLEQVSPAVGRLDEQAFHDLLRTDPDAAVALLADLGAATDPQLRTAGAAARGAAVRARRPARRGHPARVPAADVRPGRGRGRPRPRPDPRGRRRAAEHADQLIARRWTAPRRALCLLVDHSGSMRGHAVGLAAMAAAAVVLTRERARQHERDRLRRRRARPPGPGRRRERPAALVDDLLSLRGKGRTDLALALRTAARELAREPAAERLAIVLSDCRVTAGGDPLQALSGLDRVDVLGTADEPDAVAAGRALAARGGGRYLPATRFRELQSSLVALLS